MKLEKIFNLLSKGLYLLLIFLFAITLLIPAVKIDETLTKMYIFDIISLNGATTSSETTYNLFYGMLIIILYLTGTFMIFSKNKIVKYIGTSIQFAYLALNIVLNVEFKDSLRLIPSDFTFHTGGLDFHLAMLILLFIFTLAYIILQELSEHIDLQSLFKPKKTEIDKLKELYNEGLITEEEFKKKVLGDSYEAK